MFAGHCSALRALANTLIPQVDFVETIVSKYDQTLHELLQSAMSASDVATARARLVGLRVKIHHHNLSMTLQKGLGVTRTSACTTANDGNEVPQVPSTITSATRPPFSCVSSAYC
jgi:hypothetical protein